MMALAIVAALSQCRKPDVEAVDSTAKVRISCTIPLNNDDKTDFTNILNGEVNWSAEKERIYLALPYSEENHQIVELTSVAHDGQQPTLTFSGNVTAGSLVTDGETSYDVWYLGRSEESKLVEGSVTGSIATQSGDLSELGYHHIAKATVTASEGANGGIVLSISNFVNQIAIAHLDLTNVAGLSGNAIVGTDYTLEYINGAYRLNVTGNKSINIIGIENKMDSYVVLFPTNENNAVMLNSDSNKKITFHNGIKQNKLYKENNNTPLIWELQENKYECVDLGLPSGVKWATCNVGANTPEAYGDYFAWGEIETKDEYTDRNCNTLYQEISNISGNPTYDAATAKWGEDWRMPTKMEMQELIDNCTWTWTQLNGVKGYNVIGPNANSIFIPATGTYLNTSHYFDNVPYYWTSTPTTAVSHCDAAFTLNKSNEGTVKILEGARHFGRTIRPVTGRRFDFVEVTTKEVTEIQNNSAKCGGNVIEDYGREVTERGICWSTSENPTIYDNKIPCGQGKGEYSVTLTGLKSGTSYYVRAYAINEAGISYGSQVRFTTSGYKYDFSNMESHAVDLGLPSGVLWSDCNIGAEGAIDKVKNEGEWTENIYGNYFMWACVNSSQYFGEGYYPDYAKACNSNYDYSYNYSGDIRYDAATYNFGGNWRTPTTKDFFELRDNCDWEYVEIKKDGIEIYCVKYTNKKDSTKFIYFPLGGYYDSDSELTYRKDTGRFLISELQTHTGCRYIGLCDTKSECRWFAAFRWCGYNVRPVIGPIPE